MNEKNLIDTMELLKTHGLWKELHCWNRNQLEDGFLNNIYVYVCVWEGGGYMCVQKSHTELRGFSAILFINQPAEIFLHNFLHQMYSACHFQRYL
jgi:hypothetical protein